MGNNKIQTFWLDKETIDDLEGIVAGDINLDSRSDAIRQAIKEFVDRRSHKAKRPSIKIIND